MDLITSEYQEKKAYIECNQNPSTQICFSHEAMTQRWSTMVASELALVRRRTLCRWDMLDPSTLANDTTIGPPWM
jgi:hypothetical protein